ncbi:tyrosinase [Alternaria panax]|uniref:Tyrosinase n=1 Tax=Alternaria panax TaxID=48097 RepID=A0AAD4F923_9PLEO|nr:tyrosinase [Alternaria panax]
MRFCGISAIALALVCIASSAAIAPRDDLLTDLQSQAMEALKQAEANGTLARRGCSLSNVYFVYSYEKALREDCGYKGYQPYWNWFNYHDDLSKSPVFDGFETSMGGDGAFLKHNGSISCGGLIPLPSGNGGGCIKRGPFKNLQLNLGPILPATEGYPAVTDPFEWNPRCAQRDFVSTTEDYILTNLFNMTLGQASKSMYTFQNEFQGRFSDGFLGTHTAEHVKVGGDAADFL